MRALFDTMPRELGLIQLGRLSFSFLLYFYFIMCTLVLYTIVLKDKETFIKWSLVHCYNSKIKRRNSFKL